MNFFTHRFKPPVLTHMRGRHVVLTGMLMLILFFYAKCSNSSESIADPQDALIKTWALTSAGYIQKDETDVSSDFTDFTITFNEDGSYSTQNAGELLSASGTWIWANSGVTQIVLDGDLPVDVKTLSSSELNLQFTKDDGIGPGRSASIAGEYILSLRAI